MYLIKVPTSQGGMHKTGSEKAPDMIVDAISDFYTSEDSHKHNFIIDKVTIINNNLEDTNNMIFQKAEELLDNKCLFIGGDHSITYPIFKAFAKKHQNPGIIVFDAHPDCVNLFHPPSHEDWLRTLIEDGYLQPENVILVATRNIDETEKEFLEKNNIKVYHAKNMRYDMDTICDGIMELAHNFGALYLSIDIDAIDPAFAPGTGYIEPAGLTSRDMVYFVNRIKKMKNFRAADIVEVNPDKDINEMTIKLAAKLAVELW
ncbi:MAG: arginase family protein [Nanoarchaeota archaeon]|nr:arginase family protein [Nanoarchaeota archaeon]MBU4351703.1 arginase family protein [Nanoarchaeota archaeon]MBU4456692.1 arginase family protein [Nanoarchaeota archaeon]